MVQNVHGREHHAAPLPVAVTAHQVQQARAIIESMLPGQAANMDAVLLAGVAHALAVQEAEQGALRH